MASKSFAGQCFRVSGLKRNTLLSLLLLSGCQQEANNSEARPQDQSSLTFPVFFDAAMQAMGTDGVMRVEYGGEGWEACLGQPWKISEGWARWSITDYRRVIDYNSTNSIQTARRQAGMDPDMLGGCGAQPGAVAQNQRSSVDKDSTWIQQLQVHMTPVGFLLLAGKHGARIESSAGNLSVVLDDVDVNGIGHRVEGSYGNDMLLDHVITWVDDSVYGDMPFEAQFISYKDFNGMAFPSRIIHKQGGFAMLDLTIDTVISNTDASAESSTQGSGRAAGGQAAELSPYEAIGEGVYALHGSYQSVLMEFENYSVVLDGLQNDSRAREIIALAKKIMPGKPIGYVLSTHAHFDHASGLREFIAEGATIITHESNVAFLEGALGAPRTLNTDAGAANGMPVTVLGINTFLAMEDTSQRLEIYKLEGSVHADDILIAYIPSIKTVVEADLLQPWINPVFGGADHPFLQYLADELERLGLDYEQFVPVHRPPSPPLMSRADLLEAVGQHH